MKSDYTHSFNKKAVQKVIFSDLKRHRFQKLIGLAGPNINDYLKSVKKLGIKEVHVYENDYTHMLYQMRDFNPAVKTTVLYQDVYYAPVYQDVLYDLDFCCTIKNADLHIKKFKDVTSIITLSLRGVGLNATLKKFCKIIGAIKPKITFNVDVTLSYNKHLLEFNDRIYNLYEYRDTSPMLTIQPNF